jgi:TatD DNase family protein
VSKRKNVARTDPASLALPRLGVETHAHLDTGELAADLAGVMDRAGQAGVARIGNVFLGPERYLAGRGLFDPYPGVFFILGVHPHEAGRLDRDVLDRLAGAFREDRGAARRIKALGEIGLDYHYLHCAPAEVQRTAFEAQLDLARELDLPVVVHSRDAAEDTVSVLLDLGMRGRPVLWHCFGQGPDLAGIVLDHGWTLSIPGTVTYARNTELMDAVRSAPLDRLVLETDCPYLAPEPWRGKRNEPALLAFTGRKVAELKDLPVEQVWRATAVTAERFFGLADVE